MCLKHRRGPGDCWGCMHVCAHPTPGGSDGKAFAYNAGDLGSIPGSRRSPGEGNSNPLQYSCLENPMERGAWKAAVHGVAEGQTRLSNFTFTFHFHALEKEMATHSSVLAGEFHGQRSLGTTVHGVAKSRTQLSDFTSPHLCHVILQHLPL